MLFHRSTENEWNISQSFTTARVIKYYEVAREPAAGSEKNRLENRQPVWKGYN